MNYGFLTPPNQGRCLEPKREFRGGQDLGQSIHGRPAERIQRRPSEVSISVAGFLKDPPPHFRLLVFLELDRADEWIFHSKLVPHIESPTIHHNHVGPWV